MVRLSIGYYFTGDGALRDEDDDYRITGRVDDMLNCKGHRIGTAELECAMVHYVILISLFLPLPPSLSLSHPLSFLSLSLML